MIWQTGEMQVTEEMAWWGKAAVAKATMGRVGEGGSDFSRDRTGFRFRSFPKCAKFAENMNQNRGAKSAPKKSPPPRHPLPPSPNPCPAPTPSILNSSGPKKSWTAGGAEQQGVLVHVVLLTAEGPNHRQAEGPKHTAGRLFSFFETNGSDCGQVSELRGVGQVSVVFRCRGSGDLCGGWLPHL